MGSTLDDLARLAPALERLAGLADVLEELLAVLRPISLESLVPTLQSLNRSIGSLEVTMASVSETPSTAAGHDRAGRPRGIASRTAGPSKANARAQQTGSTRIEGRGRGMKQKFEDWLRTERFLWGRRPPILPTRRELGGQGSNLRHPAPKAGVLPTELPPIGTTPG